MANHRRSVEKEAYWRGQLDQQVVSGLSVRGWCRDNGVSEPSFYMWRREVRKRDLERGLSNRNPAERGVQGRLSEAAVTPGFVAVDVVTSGAVLADREAKLEIAVAGGVVIRLREDVSAETLERVLTVVCRHDLARLSVACGRHGEVGPC